MILIIDNYDSFTYNLVDIVSQHVSAEVKYVDDPDIFKLDKSEVEGVILSPGPGHPLDTDLLINIIDFYSSKPILGVCLGSQALTCYYGGDVLQGENIKHGKTDQFKRLGESRLFNRVPKYFEIMRYHSLISHPDTFPSVLNITGTTSDCIQSFEHKKFPHYGIQFHPESFATEFGEEILLNFINITQKEGTQLEYN
ncbi:aminodeoxychorismate/anthranilate synthase component II [Staphylococcus sp. SQ8-PEA]|uniref:Aminodeoxychorismate/anthranilate synthase component II n=1 Tax=Staphylococcus marylandisciuri TaxID=2981529 RepID=A0ABT2QNK0_9STAP|nr:aminodeoxychorismate/anthranilate synthase component II [Staphylococcus marylandisciuri]MCU5745566.1 aminodeoxychorismate/anthranilate synthase component II [Staphylococcus marylandisciuri]